MELNKNYYLHVRGKGAKDRLVPAPRVYSHLSPVDAYEAMLRTLREGEG